MTSTWTCIGHLNLDASHHATPTPLATPMRPPAIESTSASIRNWSRMLDGFAPIAMRMPISRVRSVTLTSMMFMMPMPPTSSETAATLASSVVIVSVPSACAPAISVRLRIEKSSSAPGGSGGDRGAARVTSSSARCVVSELVACTYIWPDMYLPRPPWMRCANVVDGMNAASS